MATRRKNPKRVAAGKKAARTRRKNSSTPARRRRSPSRSKSKGFLSDPSFKHSMKSEFSGAAGGMMYGLADEFFLQDMSPFNKLLVTLGVGFVAAQNGMPYVASGMAGAAVFDFQNQQGGLSGMLSGGNNDANWVNPLYMAQLPPVLNDGDEAFLSDPSFLSEHF